MTIQQMHDFFDLISDKYASPYFSDDEKDVFINKAISSFIEDTWQNIKKKRDKETDPPYGGEDSIYTIESIAPLIIQDYIVVLNGSSVAVRPNDFSHLLNIALVGELDECNNPVGDTYNYCRFVRHNDFYKHLENTFKKPSNKYPIYTINELGFKVLPLSPSHGVKMTYIREFTKVSLSGNIDCELPEFTHGKILMLALSLAGLSVREQSLMNGSDMKRGEGIE